jgi:hypothetical protein
MVGLRFAMMLIMMMMMMMMEDQREREKVVQQFNEQSMESQFRGWFGWLNEEGLLAGEVIFTVEMWWLSSN